LALPVKTMKSGVLACMSASRQCELAFRKPPKSLNRGDPGAANYCSGWAAKEALRPVGRSLKRCGG
jgi:hypothetical protein